VFRIALLTVLPRVSKRNVNSNFAPWHVQVLYTPVSQLTKGAIELSGVFAWSLMGKHDVHQTGSK